MLIRPVGYVAWAGDLTDPQLPPALENVVRSAAASGESAPDRVTARRPIELAVTADYEIRRLRPGDERRAVALVETFKPRSRTVTAMREFLEVRSHHLIGAFAGSRAVGMLIGYAMARPDGRPDMMQLYDIEVAEDHRRRGIGRALVAELLAAANGKVFVITNESNAAAMALYTACGGRRVGDDDVLFALRSEAGDV